MNLKKIGLNISLINGIGKKQLKILKLNKKNQRKKNEGKIEVYLPIAVSNR